jgi:NADH-quinone oxidoreductase subunit A
MEPIAPGLSPWEPNLAAMAVYAALVAGLLAAILALTGLLGQRRPGLEKGRAYESGIIPTGGPMPPNPVPFFLVAAFFLVFDVEAVYIFAWAVDFAALGWTGLARMAGFIGVLLLGLYYILAKGGLAWGPR